MPTILLFGQSPLKGDTRFVLLQSLEDLSKLLGNTLDQLTLGAKLAVNSLLSHQDVLFFSVEKEGFSLKDYHAAVEMIEKKKLPEFEVIAIPGVSDTVLIQKLTQLTSKNNHLLLKTEKDLYQYLSDLS